MLQALSSFKPKMQEVGLKFIKLSLPCKAILKSLSHQGMLMLTDTIVMQRAPKIEPLLNPML
jgi:hypothetical protein